MGAVAVKERAPSLADACRAADELVRAGVGTVLLFGSVARGEATDCSDIDLVAIFDDLGDYGHRHDVQVELQRRARDAAGWPADVFVTDAPEWAVRTHRVPCSFEAGIAATAIRLADSGVHDRIDWGKEIGMPADVEAELTRRFRDLAGAVLETTERLYPGVRERAAAEAGEAVRHKTMELERFSKVCDAVHKVFEASAKITWAITSKKPAQRTHRIDVPLETQPEWVGEAFDAAAADVSLAKFFVWHQAALYSEMMPIHEFDETYLWDHVSAAIRIAAFASEQGRHRNIDIELMDELDRRREECVLALNGSIRVNPVER